MSVLTGSVGPAWNRRVVPSPRTSPVIIDEREFMLRDMCNVLFASLPRKDQRQKAELYLRGLLATKGRKSIRNVAACLGDPALQQTLHHFICESTWDWHGVREALAYWIRCVMTPQAWVVRQLPIPKSGHHSVGVSRGLDLYRNRVFHGQQAFGVWCASEEVAAPVNWRLLLSEQAGDDHGADADAARGRVPSRVVETPEECATTAALGFTCLQNALRRPVVLDLPVHEPEVLLRRFGAAGVPVLARVASTARFAVKEPALARNGGAGVLPAQRILDSVEGHRRRIARSALVSPMDVRHTRALKIRVGLPGGTSRLQRAPEGGFVLLGERGHEGASAPQPWITNMSDAPTSALLGLSRSADRVGRDLADYGDHAGLRDFEGRSLRGWHCHMTLASAAHALEALAASRQKQEGYVPKVS
ncbi:transposase [Streptomyces sp. ISL-10]|uniref:IS701 family transposase n=1 Tax=Streptomyces sp. ISL-10 TaxID=2819172 RepID=UPI001BEA504D|nr:transposase [Streptomyces sp. ISL-10]MBT2368691.1 transposase [Streptomyces sp. ISL-10]